MLYGSLDKLCRQARPLGPTTRRVVANGCSVVLTPTSLTRSAFVSTLATLNGALYASENVSWFGLPLEILPSAFGARHIPSPTGRTGTFKAAVQSEALGKIATHYIAEHCIHST